MWQQAIEASTQSPLEHIRKPAEQLLKACEEIPGYTSVLASIAGTRAAATDARAAAVILLKNMVRVRWKSRGGRGFVVGEGEKANLRGFLLRVMDEPEEKVASQVSLFQFVLVHFTPNGQTLLRVVHLSQMFSPTAFPSVRDSL